MLAGVLLGMIVVLRWFPGTALARWLERQVTEVRRRLARIERRHVLFAVLLTLIVVFAGEALAMLGPLEMGLVVLFDVSTYIDIVLVAGTMAAIACGRGVLQWIAMRLPRPRARARRTPPIARGERAAANDEEDQRTRIAA